MSDTSITLSVHGHEFEISPPFTNRELHLIKQIAGVRAGELFAAIEGGDTDILVALAHIGIKRAGRHQPTLDMLWELPAGEIGVATPEADDGPPTSTPTGEDEAGSPATTP